MDEKYVIIQDELTAMDTLTTVRWTMLTQAEVAITGKNTATLTKNGKQLFLQVDAPARINLKTWSTEPATDFDAPNPGTTLVGFEIQVPANKKETIQVKLIPQGQEKKSIVKIKDLQNWPQ